MKRKLGLTELQTMQGLNELIISGLRDKSPYHYKIYQQVIALDKLPREIDCKRLFAKFENTYGKGSYAGIMSSNRLYQTVHDKLIEDISRLSMQLEPKTAVEVCSGIGKISYHLNQNNVEIIPTDIVATEHVKGLSYLKAIKKYSPDLVIAAWPAGYDSTFVNNVMRQDGVKHLIVIGKGGYFARKYWRSILKHSEIIPIELRSFPSVADSVVNSEEESKKMIRAMKWKFHVGKSEQVHQAILFRSKRNK